MFEFKNTHLPLWTLNPFNAACAELRIAEISKYFLLKTTRSKFQARPFESEFSYVTIVRKSDLALCRLSLQSYNKVSRFAPKLLVGLDESLSKADALDFFSTWPGGVEILSISDVANWHRSEGNNRMATFCEKHVFGFKHALCLLALKKERKRVLYCDSDVLWFRDGSKLLECYGKSNLVGTTDCGFSYNRALLDKFPKWREVLLGDSGINAGFAIYNRTPEYGDEEIQILDAILEETPIHFFSEQTLFAILVRKQGAMISNGDVTNFEKRSASPSWLFKNWYARHYVSSIRFQFWTDALFL